MVKNSGVPVLINPCPAEPRYNPAFANSVDPDQLAWKPTDLDLHYSNIWIK